jgi:hypothetical protein
MLSKDQLLAIDKLATQPVGNIRTQNPDLFAQLQKTIADQRKTAVFASFQGASKELQASLQKIDFAGAAVDQPLDRLVLTALQAQRVKPEVAKEAIDRLVDLGRTQLLNDPAGFDLAIADHPLFQQELQQATFYKLAGATGLADAKAQKLIERVPNVASLDDDALKGLVKDRLLTDAEAKAFGLTLSLYHLTDNNLALANQLKSGAFASLGQGKVTGPRDLAALTADEWAGAIQRAQAAPPEGLDVATYAAQLAKTAADLFPTDAMVARSVPRDTRPLAPALERVTALLKQNRDAFGRPFEELDVRGISAQDLPQVRAAHEQLTRLSRLHPGLGLNDVLNGTAPPADKLKAVGDRLGLLSKVAQQNPDVELLAVDYSAGSDDRAALNLGGLSADQQKMVLTDLKAQQRTFALTRDVDHAQALLAAGYHSAASIASGSLEAFQNATALPAAAAAAYYDSARSAVARVSTAVTSIIDIFRGGFDGLAVGNLYPSLQDYLKNLDGFASLFGSQDYCRCQHCQSILSPAAYFVDLMRFIEEHVSDKYFAGPHSGHVLSLKVRRPDLWTLPLTCKNTDELIPYLDIINEILENYIAVGRGYGGSLADRGAVEDVVYRQALAVLVNSLRQPFVLPLARLDSYLDFFGRSRADVARTLSAPANVLAAAAFTMSQREYELVTQPNVNLPFLQGLFGVPFNAGAGGVIDPFDAQLMIKYTGFTRDDLGQLVGTRFVAAALPAVTITPEKTSFSSVQNDIERIHNLTANSLDRIHRFARLWRRSPWSVPELDLVLTHLDKAGLATGIGEPALAQMVSVRGLIDRWQIPIEQACALWSDIPQIALDPARGSLFDRLFNFAPFVQTDGALPKDAVKFIHPSFRQAGTPLPADNTLHRLAAGLQLSSDQLAILITGLAGPLGVNLGTANEADRGFALKVANLTLLDRHASLARLLKLSLADFFQLVRLAALPGGRVASMADLTALLAFYDWWKSTSFRLDDLSFITRGTVQAPANYPDKDAIAARIVADVRTAKALQFADTVFAFLAGVTEEQSRAIITANAAYVQPTADGSALMLTGAFTPATGLTVPAGVTVAEPAARALLLQYHPSQVLPVRLAAQTGLSVDKAAALLTMAGTNLSDPALLTALKGGAIAPLFAVLDRILALTVLFRNPVFDPPALDFIRTHAAVFGIADFGAVTMDGVRKTAVYVRLTDTSALAAFTAGSVAVDPAAVRQSFAGFDPVQKFAAVDRAQLAAALRSDPTLLATLLPNLPLSATAPEALAAAATAVALCGELGVGGDALKLIISSDYGDLRQASDAVLSAFRARFSSDDEFLTQLAPYDDRVRSRRRDALTDALLRSVQPAAFDTLNQLYEYFLVDVQLEGCARTSRLVAAISSAQLYVYRVLMNLEQDRRDPADPAHVHVPPERIPAAEWSWRQNYRVWEANRKVFLYPENYIEPELRDDKTPQFRDLESTLMQQQITEQNVLDAYATYLSSFDDVSKLKVAGSYHDKHAGSRTDTLHLFGCTPADPPAYYYRTIENAYYGEIDADRGVMYGPWQKVNVQIPVRKVAPAVYLGRLFLFWVEVATSTKNEVKDGGSKFVGYRHRLTLKYTTLRLDSTWTPPQIISLSNPDLYGSGDGVVEDPLAEPSELQDLADALARFDFTAAADAMRRLETPRFDTRVHLEPIDGYTLTGFKWDEVYPQIGAGSSLTLTGRNFVMRAGVDFYNRVIFLRPGLHGRKPYLSGLDQVLCSRKDGNQRHLYFGVQPYFRLDAYAQCSAIAMQERIDQIAADPEISWLVTSPLQGNLTVGLYQQALANLADGAEIDVIDGSLNDAIVDCSGDLIWLQKSVRPGKTYLLKRLGTTLGERLSRTLFTGGVNALLATDTQLGLAEAALPVGPLAYIENAGNAGKLDFRGAFGTYYREIYFHIPFLIAKLLNTQQNFAAAQRWYQYIFDPTADDSVPLPPGLTPAERAKRERDRVWRYREFRGLDVPTLRAILTDPLAIEAYKKDPFNPHAIARLRLSAYQKCIVMRYVDNLLDWGDSLFTQFTMESVNEATMIYVLALDILGPRPAALGDCGEGRVSPKDYQTIGPLMKQGSDFLIELESYIWVKTGGVSPWPKKRPPLTFTVDRPLANFFVKETVRAPRFVRPVPAPEAAPVAVTANGSDGASRAALAVGRVPPTVVRTVRLDEAAMEAETAAARTTLGPLQAANAVVGIQVPLASFEDGLARPGDWHKTVANSWSIAKDKPIRRIGNDSGLIHDFGRAPRFGWGLIRQLSPVFCIPDNPDLRQYWDRVEDRLYKIRHCMDITGGRRQLALFAPEIDPRLLVRARAAGLSLEDVLGSTSGDLPPYRFTYLIDKAKQYAAALQGFGSQLLSALEKRDLEELNLLRTVHQQNLLKMTTQMRQQEIDIAADTIQSLERQRDAIQYRHDYYQGLIDSGLTTWESTQQVARYASSILQGAAGLTDTIAGIVYLIPQIGSPFAMKYGGTELGNSANAWATVMRDLASVGEAIGALTGLEAGFERRKQGWQHQVDLADHELKQLDQQLAAGQLRKSIAVRSLDVHNKTIDQAEEVYEFFNSRFTNLGLYTWLAATLQRTYRQAFDGVYSLARLAEQAFRFERGDDTTLLLNNGFWDSTRAGLLAGDRLMVELQNLERRFIETNYRTLEVDQSFSLTQINPAALVQLRQTGTCQFQIPELFFDLFYPGQYRRRIKSVRLTIPCVTGPFTNVSATLALTGSKIRPQPQLGAANLVDVPRRRSVAIATSTAQNDAGVFEFSFRDERYMPFEGAGAISSWALTLPANFRQFDYQSINEVILHISYQAEGDELFRTRVEQLNAAMEGTILNVLSNQPLARVISLRQEFSAVLNRLVHSAANTAVRFPITDKYLPIFLRNRNIQVSAAKLVLSTPAGQTVGGVTLTLDGVDQTGFAHDAQLANLWAKDVLGVFAGGLVGEHTLSVKSAGDLAPVGVPGDNSVLDAEKFRDILLYIEYHAA